MVQVFVGGPAVMGHGAVCQMVVTGQMPDVTTRVEVDVTTVVIVSIWYEVRATVCVVVAVWTLVAVETTTLVEVAMLVRVTPTVLVDVTVTVTEAVTVVTGPEDPGDPPLPQEPNAAWQPLPQ